MEGGPCTLCLELDEFDREYQATLASLTKRRRDILKRINQRHDPFIQHLPLELASKVFAFCLPQQVFDSDPVKISLFWDASKGSNITPFNIVLGSICQSWRRIAWSTPDLWSTLPIRLHRWYESTRVDLTLEWLSRSSQIPLDVAIAYDSTEILTEENIGLWKPLIDIVNSCSSRWRTFIMDVPQLVHSYIVGNGEPTSILERLKIGPANSFRRCATGFSLANARPMPSQLVSGSVPLRLIDIGWSNLTTVRLDGLYINECLDLLKCAPQLVTFQIDRLGSGKGTVLPALVMTTHNTLKILDISGLDRESTAQQLLDFLTLPSLVKLLYDSYLNSLQNVLAFLQRSGCSLTDLYIVGYHSDHFSEITMVPSLQALEGLGYHGDPTHCLLCLNRPKNRDDSPIFLPNLHKLIIRSDGPRGLSGLADLFLTRPMRTLSIHYTYPIDEWVDKKTALRFQDLVKKGHDITIMGLLKGETGEERDQVAPVDYRSFDVRNNDNSLGPSLSSLANHIGHGGLKPAVVDLRSRISSFKYIGYV